MVNVLAVLVKLTLFMKALFYFGIAGAAVWWLIDKLIWRYNVLVIDKRDTSGKELIFDRGSLAKDKQGKFYIKLKKERARVEVYPHEFVYHTRGLFKKGTLVVHKIGMNAYVQGSVVDLKHVKKKVLKLDEDGKPVIDDVTNQPVYEEKDIDIYQAIVRAYEPKMAFYRDETRRDIERHNKQNWFKENAMMIISVAALGIVVFALMLTLRFSADMAGSNQGAIKIQADANKELYKAMIAFRDRDCGMERVAPEALLQDAINKQANKPEEKQPTAAERFLKK